MPRPAILLTLALALAVALALTGCSATTPPAASATPGARATPGAPTAVATSAQSLLSYVVQASGAEYPFVVSVFQNDADGIAFRFDLGDGQARGTVAMSAAAVEDATIMLNRFTSRGYELTDKTSVWLAREPFARLKAGEAVGLDLGQGTWRDFSGACGETYTVGTASGSGYSVPACRFETDGAGAQQTLVVADDAAQPLILSMQTGMFGVSLATALPRP